MDTMFILRLVQPLQGYYDSGKYVTLSTDNITFTFLTDLGDMIQWHSGLSIGEDLNFKELHTDEILINYQMVK
jgi:hypothetical protein